MSDINPDLIPNGWLKCPRKATGLLVDRFLAFKTPLNSRYNDQVQDIYRFTPTMLFDFEKSLKRKIGLWIDLTNASSQFYDNAEIASRDCKYVKMYGCGHGETPTPDQTQQFIEIVSDFINKKPDEIIGVHCIHGFNRTGFLIVSYMIEKLDFSLDVGLLQFSKARVPGIYKQDYIEELYKRYDDVKHMISAPEQPQWCKDEEVNNDVDKETSVSQIVPIQNSNSASSSRNRRVKNREFMAGVSGVQLFENEPRTSEVLKKTQDFCGRVCTGTWSELPGARPVPMDIKNIELLQYKPYRVSWKADGVRYMMLIDGEDEVYMIDRNNCVFKVPNLRFLHKKYPDRHLSNTLLDGVLVIDKLDGVQTPRYLCYDIIRLENIDVGMQPFHPVRLGCIQNEIIRPRQRAITEGRIAKEREPFGVKLKGFWDVTKARSLLEEKFVETLRHETDGLIFQPSNEPFFSGRCTSMLKWKPSYINSLDLELKIIDNHHSGTLAKQIGCLYAGGGGTMVGTIHVTEEMKDLHKKIVECMYENDEWVFVRERPDKSRANSYYTVKSVCDAKKNPVTKEYLLNYIEKQGFSTTRPSPWKRARRL